MIPTYIFPYPKGGEGAELRIGWASWDDGNFTERSIKFAYRDDSGKISRGAPELPFYVLLDMCALAYEQNELKDLLPRRSPAPAPVEDATLRELQDEKKSLSLVIARLQRLMMDVKWADWKAVYNQIGGRLEAVKAEIEIKKNGA